MSGLDYLLLFDPQGPKPDMHDIMLYTLVIMVCTNFIFMILMYSMDRDPKKSMKDEKDKEFEQWKKRNVSLWTIIGSEVFNSSIYSPIAEEFTFRFLLMKVLLHDSLKLGGIQANIIQSSIFALLHMSNHTYTLQTKKFTYIQILSAFISGMISGMVYKYSNSILPCVFAHILNNGVSSGKEIIEYIKWLEERGGQ